MDKTLFLSDGQQMAIVYRRKSCRRHGMTRIGIQVFNQISGLFQTLTETLLPTADDVGLDLELERTIDKALAAGYSFTRPLSIGETLEAV